MDFKNLPDEIYHALVEPHGSANSRLSEVLANLKGAFCSKSDRKEDTAKENDAEQAAPIPSTKQTKTL
tara:strand:- start:887 stop:1090 length:204 start_codon:yes stop_codon:yes gene_type:complete